MQSEHLIRELRIEDLGKVERLLNKYLSFGLASQKDLLTKVDSRNNLCMIEKGKLVGYIASEQLAKIDEVFLNHGDVIRDVKKVYSPDKSMIISHLVVNEEDRKSGRGTKLLESVLSYFPNSDFYAIGWVKGTTFKWDAETIFRKAGFRLLIHKDNFWLTDSLKKSYSCPYCEKGCICSAKIYHLGRKLLSKEELV